MEEELKGDTIRDVITENPYYKLTDQQLYDRSRYLSEKNKYMEKKHLQVLADIKLVKSSLPVFQKRYLNSSNIINMCFGKKKINVLFKLVFVNVIFTCVIY